MPERGLLTVLHDCTPIDSGGFSHGSADMTTLDLLTEPALVAKAKEEFAPR